MMALDRGSTSLPRQGRPRRWRREYTDTVATRTGTVLREAIEGSAFRSRWPDGGRAGFSLLTGIQGPRRARSPAGWSLDPSQLNVPTWLGEVRDLFPRDVVEVIEKHALDR